MSSEAIIKASIFGETAEVTSNLVPLNEDEAILSSIGAIAPPYDPEALSLMFERSSNLRPNIDVLATNVEGFGYRLVPAIDLTAPDAEDKIRDSLLVEALFDGELPDLDADAVTARKRELEVLERIERLRTEQFLSSCCVDSSFLELRLISRQDEEVTGNAFWEVLRNKFGEAVQISHVPTCTMRLVRSDTSHVEVEMPVRVSDVSVRTVTRRRRFRRYVQVIRGQEVAWFKQYGDPRAISSKTGRIYGTESELKEKEPTAKPATEIIHHRVYSPLSVYGVPRWVGSMLAVLGTRASEEVNVDYFHNKAVPPIAVLVSGGVLAAGAADRIGDYIANQIKGKSNFHAILVLEAESAQGAVTGMQGARTRIEIKNLMDAQNRDALFQTYEQNNTEKVGASFRIPRILRGAMTDFNRATSESAIRYAEQQVFNPERVKIDYVLNQILLDRGVRFIRLVSNGPVEKDPPVLVEMVAKLVDAGVITPNEGRAIVGDAFNTRLDDIDAPWARIPVKAAEAGFAPEPTAEEIEQAEKDGNTARPDIKLAPTDAARVVTVNEARASLKLPPLTTADGKPDPKGLTSMSEFIAANEGKAGIDAGPVQQSLEQQAVNLVQLRDALREVEGQAGQAAITEAREREEELRVEVPKTEWDTWFQQEPIDQAAPPP